MSKEEDAQTFKEIALKSSPLLMLSVDSLSKCLAYTRGYRNIMNDDGLTDHPKIDKVIEDSVVAITKYNEYVIWLKDLVK